MKEFDNEIKKMTEDADVWRYGDYINKIEYITEKKSKIRLERSSEMSAQTRSEIWNGDKISDDCWDIIAVDEEDERNSVNIGCVEDFKSNNVRNIIKRAELIRRKKTI